jgi:hypothetical protein
MQLPPRPEMISRLDSAWTFLTGQASSFSQSVPDFPTEGEAQFKFVMPVVSPHDRVDELMAIGLLIDPMVATVMAAFMFAIPESAVSTHDLKDVCREACNVLGSCLVQHEGAQSGGVELGLPQEVSHEVFAQLQENATVSVTFETRFNGKRVVITVLDAVRSGIMECLS